MIFGANARVKLHGAKKLNVHAKKGSSVGYNSKLHGYRVCYADQCKAVIEREVVFDLDKAGLETAGFEGANNIQSERERAKHIMDAASAGDAVQGIVS